MQYAKKSQDALLHFCRIQTSLSDPQSDWAAEKVQTDDSLTLESG